MTKILVIHGAGMDMRGKVQTEVFGTMTLPEYDVKIKDYASKLEVDVDIFRQGQRDRARAALSPVPGVRTGNDEL